MTIYGLLPLQSAIAYECTASGQDDLYQVYVELDWHGDLDRARLEQALQAVAIRHPALRGAATPWDQSDMVLPLPVLGRPGLPEAGTPVSPTAPGPARLELRQLEAGSYRLRIGFHHIIADRLSMEHLVDELVAFYQEPAPALPVHPLDYHGAVAGLFPNGDALLPARRYWRETLEGVPTRSRWRFGREVSHGKVRRVEARLDAATYGRICQLAQDHRLTRQALVLAACAAAVAGASDGSSQVIGIPVGLHDLLTLDVPAIGPFVETLPLRLDLSGDSSLLSVAQQAQQRLAEAHEHRLLPFSEIVRELGLAGSQGSPLIQTVFAWGGEQRQWDAGGARLTMLPPEPYPTLLDFSVLAHPDTQGGLWLAIDYAVPRFDPAAAQQLLTAMLHALQAPAYTAFANVPAMIVAQPPAVWFGPEDVAVGADWVSRLVSRLAAEPDSLALVTETEDWTAGRLAALAAEIDAGIVARAGRQATVVLCAERSPAQVATLLAALAGGHRLAMLDPDESPAMQAKAAAAVNAGLVLVGSATANRFVSLCPQWQLPECAGPAAPHLVDSGLPASLLLFTSGTTGEPRPVVLPADAVARHAHWFAAATRMGAADRILQFCSVGFDASLEELLPALGAGVPVVLRNREAAASAEAFVDYCRRHQVSIADLPTGFFRLLVSELADTGLSLPASLRLVVIGGEAASDGMVAQWRVIAPGVKLLNSYGPTEATVVVSAGEAPGLGSPRPGINLYLLDGWLRPVVDGQVGELYIGGHSLALGYLAHPVATASRFLPDPFAGQAGARMYRTGDLALRDANGSLRFVSRADRQVKIRGYRVEPAALEAAWRELDGVMEAIVAVTGDQLRLAVQMTKGSSLEAVQAAIRARFAAPCWPTRLLAVEHWPTTLRGKIDRAAVARMLASSSAMETADAGKPDHPLLALIAELAGLPAVRPDQNFLAIGGHSLLALKLAGEARRRLAIKLPVSSLFNAPDFASLLADLPAASELAHSLPTAECSSIETAILLDDALHPGTSPYLISESLQLDGPLDPDRLGQALRTLVAHQSHLTRRLDTDPAGRWQTVAVEEAVASALAPATGTGFVLQQVPGWRLRHDAKANRLTLEAHHAVMDGRSIALFWQLLASAYRGQPLRAVTALAPASDPTDDAWWQQRLAGADATTNLPADQAAATMGQSAAHCVTVELDPALLERLQQTCPATLFATVLAVTAGWLQRATRSEDLLLGVAVSTAEHHGFADTIRPLLAILPLRVGQSAGLDFPTMLAGVSRDLGLMLDHSAASVQCLGRLLRQAGSDRGLPAFLFDLSNADESAELDFGGCRGQIVAIPTRQVRADVEFSFEHGKQGARLHVRARAALYRADTVAAWAESWRHFLQQLARNPYCLLAQPSLIDSASPFAASEAATRPAAPLDMAAEFIRLLESEADRLLLREGEHLMRRSALAGRVGAIAAGLLAGGVAAGARVGLVLPRSADHLAALLAVWRIGAIAVLIDPAHPAGRLAGLTARTPLQALLLRDLDPARRDSLAATCIIDMADLPEHGPLPPQAALGEVAYIAFTSGSTGTPRAVLCHWQGFATLLGWSRHGIPLGPDDRFLHLAAPAFDIALWELFHPLLSGAMLDILPAAKQGDVAHIADLIHRHGITAAHFVPSLLGPFLEIAGENNPLRQVIAGGEALSPALYEGVRRLGAVLHHTYGPTETSIFMLCWHGRGPNPFSDRLPLGSPIDGCTVAVVDDSGVILPRGLLGELRITGPQVSGGYLGDPRETARRFRPHSQGRSFHSGDQVRMRVDGSLEYHGRQDRQVKINGMRIELAEVEGVLESVPGISRAIAMLRRDPGGNQRLVAYLTGPGAVAPAGLLAAAKSCVQGRLPGNARPFVMLVLTVFPLTVNGKVDQKALPEPDWSLPAHTARQAGNALELKVLQAWREVLGRPDLGLDHDLFTVGGDSISAIRIVSRLRSQGESLGLTDVFRHASPAALAAFLQARPSGGAAGPADCHSLQTTPAAAAWLEFAGPAAREGVQAVHLKVPEGLNGTRLRAAWTKVWARHDSLRQQIEADGAGGWRIRILQAEGAAPFVEVDPAAAETLLTAAVDAIDLHTGRAAVLSSIRGGSRLVLAAHHVAIDWQGWSQLAAELAAAYADQSLPLLPEGRFAAAAAVLRQKCHWHGSSGGAHRTRRFGAPALLQTVEVDSNVLSLLRAAASRRRLPLDVLLAAAVAQALAGMAGDDELDIDLESDGRLWLPADVEAGTLGWFATLQRLRIDRPAADDSWLDQAELGYRRVGPLQAQTLAPVVLNLVVSGPTVAPEDWQPDLSAESRLDLPPCHAIAIEAICSDEGLLIALDLDGEGFERDQLTALAARLRAAIETLTSDAETGSRYPLTPLQSGMLFDSLRDRSAYHTQICYAVEGQVDPARLREAWRRVCLQHEVFRLVFRWEGLDKPYQYRSESLVFDWQTIAAGDATVSQALERCLADDRARPFELATPALSRFYLIAATDGNCLLWSHHHLLFDGWSLPLVTEAVGREYLALEQGRELPAPAAQFSDFIAWSTRQPSSTPHWQAALARLARPCLLAPLLPPGPRQPGSRSFRLDAGLSEALRQLAGRRRQTLHGLILSAWCLTLARLTGLSQVACGLVVSQRPGELAGSEEIVGLCMSTVPLVVDIDSQRGLAVLLDSVGERLVEALHHSHGSLGQARQPGAPGLPFDSMLVFENYPGDREGVPLGDAGALRVLPSHEHGGMPFVLVCLPDACIGFELILADLPGLSTRAGEIERTLSRILRLLAESALSQ